MDQGNFYQFSEETFKKYLDCFIEETQEAIWLWEIDLDNVNIEFCDYELKQYDMFHRGNTTIIYLNKNKYINEVFSNLIGSLFVLYFKKTGYLSYLLHKYFFRKKLLEMINDKLNISNIWFKETYCNIGE